MQSRENNIYLLIVASIVLGFINILLPKLFFSEDDFYSVRFVINYSNLLATMMLLGVDLSFAKLFKEQARKVISFYLFLAFLFIFISAFTFHYNDSYSLILAVGSLLAVIHIFGNYFRLLRFFVKFTFTNQILTKILPLLALFTVYIFDLEAMFYIYILIFILLILVIFLSNYYCVRPSTDASFIFTHFGVSFYLFICSIILIITMRYPYIYSSYVLFDSLFLNKSDLLVACSSLLFIPCLQMSKRVEVQASLNEQLFYIHYKKLYKNLNIQTVLLLFFVSFILFFVIYFDLYNLKTLSTMGDLFIISSGIFMLIVCPHSVSLLAFKSEYKILLIFSFCFTLFIFLLSYITLTLDFYSFILLTIPLYTLGFFQILVFIFKFKLSSSHLNFYSLYISILLLAVGTSLSHYG